MNTQKSLFEVFNDKSRWCTNYFAKNAYGQPCYIFHEFAHSWCMEGALELVADNRDASNETKRAIYQLLLRTAPFKHVSIASINDCGTLKFQDIIAWLTRAAHAAADEPELAAFIGQPPSKEE